MSHFDISEKDKQAIDKKELDEFEQKRVRGTGYDMMKIRDQGWGKLHDERAGGKDVVLEWHVDYKEDADWPEYTLRNRLPKEKFLLKVGKEEALIDKEAFQRLFRWV